MQCVPEPGTDKWLLSGCFHNSYNSNVTRPSLPAWVWLARLVIGACRACLNYALSYHVLMLGQLIPRFMSITTSPSEVCRAYIIGRAGASPPSRTSGSRAIYTTVCVTLTVISCNFSYFMLCARAQFLTPRVLFGGRLLCTYTCNYPGASPFSPDERL